MFVKILDELTHSFENSQSELSGFLAHEEFVRICRKYLKTKSEVSAFFHAYKDDLLFMPKRNTGKSFIHENGFTKISLWKSSSDHQLRLHIYPLPEFVNSGIHSHRWNLSSFLLAGTLNAFNYTLSDSGDAKMDLYKLYDEVGGEKKIEKYCTRSVHIGASYMLGAFGDHYLESSHLHKVRKPSGVKAISLVFSGKPNREYSVISEGANVKQAQRSFLSRSEIEGVMTELNHDFLIS